MIASQYLMITTNSSHSCGIRINGVGESGTLRTSEAEWGSGTFKLSKSGGIRKSGLCLLCLIVSLKDEILIACKYLMITTNTSHSRGIRICRVRESGTLRTGKTEWCSGTFNLSES